MTFSCHTAADGEILREELSYGTYAAASFLPPPTGNSDGSSLPCPGPSSGYSVNVYLVLQLLCIFASCIFLIKWMALTWPTALPA